MLSRMCSENANVAPNNKFGRRPRSETLPTGGSYKFGQDQQQQPSSGPKLSFNMSGLDSVLPFSKGHWDGGLASRLMPFSNEKKGFPLTAHYDVAAAKTMDLLGLNGESSDSLDQLSVELTSDNTNNNELERGISSSSETEESGLESLCIKIENLNLKTTLSQLTNHVSQYGEIESIQLIKKEGVGFVTFASHQEANDALQGLSNQSFLENSLKVQFHHVETEDSKPANIMNLKSSLKLDSTPVKAPKPVFSNVYNKTKEYYQRQVEHFKLSSVEGTARGSQQHERLIMFDYAVTLPPIPNPNFKKRVDPTRLRELRKQLEGAPGIETIKDIFNETQDSWVDLCSDYIGNIIIQKLIEFGTEAQKTQLIRTVAPHMAAIGIHKNGTWAIQKMIECANSDDQIKAIADSLRPYAPALLLDQFGNYVVQCCLKFESPHNQFIFDAIYARCSEIAQGRFGARAIRTCLDSQYTVPAQKDLVSEALMRNAYPLATNPNGSLLLNWILDSHHTEHYLGMVFNLNHHLGQLCCHKLASSIIVRLINQQQDMQARDYLIYNIFFRQQPILNDMMMDPQQGTLFVQKLLNSPYLGDELRSSIQMAVSALSPPPTPNDSIAYDDKLTPNSIESNYLPMDRTNWSNNSTNTWGNYPYFYPPSHNNYLTPFYPSSQPLSNNNNNSPFFSNHH